MKAPIPHNTEVAGIGPESSSAHPGELLLARANDFTVASAAGFGASLALCWDGLHLTILNSRSAMLALPVASITALAAFCIVCVLCRRGATGSSAPSRKGALLLAFGGIFAIAFMLVFDPVARMALFCIQQTFSAGALACFTLMVLECVDLRQRLIAISAGCSIAGALGIASFGLASSLGQAENMASYTTLAVCCHGAVALACGIVLAAAFRRSVIRQADVTETIGRDESRPYEFGKAHAAVFAAICLAGVASSFFDGITFNPYVHDMPAVGLVADIVCLVGGLLLAGCLHFSGGSKLSSALFGCIAAFLGISILGIALISTSLEGAGLPIGIVESSSILLLCAAIANISMMDGADSRVVLAALACCASSWALSCGLAVKHAIGYSLATITPIVLVAIATLSIISLVLNAQSARNITAMQQSHEVELSRQARDFAVERSAERRRIAAQIEKERQARDRALEAVRREMSDRAASVSAVDRQVKVFEELGLTKREREIVMTAMQGYTIPGIGIELGIAKQTVNYHLHNIYKKLGVASKSEMLTLVNAAADDRHSDE